MLHTIIIKEEGSNKPKKIGRYDDIRNIFLTSRDITKHLFRNKNAWAIDYKLFKDVLLPVNASIRIQERKKGILYTVTSELFEKHGEVIEYNNHRPQICLNLEYFTKEKL